MVKPDSFRSFSKRRTAGPRSEKIWAAVDVKRSGGGVSVHKPVWRKADWGRWRCPQECGHRSLERPRHKEADDERRWSAPLLAHLVAFPPRHHRAGQAVAEHVGGRAGHV